MAEDRPPLAKQWWQQKDHPIWKAVNTIVSGAVILLVFAGAQYATSTSFDANEVQALGFSGGGLAIVAILRQVFKS